MRPVRPDVFGKRGPFFIDGSTRSSNVLKPMSVLVECPSRFMQLCSHTHLEISLAHVFVLLHIEPEIECILGRLALEEDLYRQSQRKLGPLGCMDAN